MKLFSVAALLLFPVVASAQSELASVPVLSVESIDIEGANRVVVEAERAGHAWVADPILVASAIIRALPFGSMEARAVLVSRQDVGGERTDSSTVIVLLDGFSDDSVRGERYAFTLVPSDTSGSLIRLGIRRTWRVIDANRAWRCLRGRDVDAFYGQLCP